MSIIDNYGEFDQPEEQTKIEVIENPVLTATTCYELLNKKLGKIYLSEFSKDEAEIVYKEAVKLLEGKEKLNPKAEEIKEIIKAIEAINKINPDEDQKSPSTYYDISGIFLSALQNKTSMDVLIIEQGFYFRNIGYKLEKNKTLIIAKNAKTYWTGENAKGNIINNGIAYQMCARVEHGVHINNRNIDYSFASSAQGGLQINNYNAFCKGYLAHNAKGGLQINIGFVNSFAYLIEGGMQIKIGISRQFADYPHPSLKSQYKIGGVKINLSDLMQLNEKQNQLKTQLQNKIEELDFLKEAKLDDKTISEVKKYDFNKFEEETKKICEEIAECCPKVLEQQYL